MKALKLVRVAYNSNGTFGVLLDDKIPFALTCERVWLNNEKEKSCIPEGMYRCKRILSIKFGDTFEITQVPGRDHCLFHKGNLMLDSHGCILIGEQFEQINGTTGILASAKGFGEFMQRTAGLDEFMLSISSDDPPK